MRLHDPALLLSYMDTQDFTQSRLAKHAQCSRQFIHMLITGKRRSCSDEVAARIERSLRVLPGTLFMSEVSATMEHQEAIA